MMHFITNSSLLSFKRLRILPSVLRSVFLCFAVLYHTDASRAQSPAMRNAQHRLTSDIPKPLTGQNNPNGIKLTLQDSLAAIEQLRASIGGLLSEHSKTFAHSKTSFGVYVHSLSRGKDLYSTNAQLAFTPASTTKLFSTFGALDKFGAAHFVETSVLTEATEVREGVLEGNVYLVGRGDPLLSVADLERLADQVAHAGIKRITGNICGDDSFFDRVTNRREYSGDDEEVQPTAPISALSINRNLITVIVSASAGASHVGVQTFPSSNDAFSFDVEATVHAPPKKKKRGAVARFGISIAEQFGQPNGKQRFVIRGTMAPGTTISKVFFIANPALTAADMLRKRLQASGIQIDGGTLLKQSPPTVSELATVQRPITDIINIVNKKSDNFAAEHVFKMLGGSTLDNPSPEIAAKDNHTVQASIEQIQGALREYGIVTTTSSVAIYDGSGLSRRNKISPSTLVRLLDRVQNAPFSNEYFNSLSIGGLDGTLQHRMRGTNAEYNARAKTGTHKNVSALAGYVKTLDGERLAFSFMFNGNAVWLYKGLENKLCEMLSNFSYFGSKESTAPLDSTSTEDSVSAKELN
ncbi:MAG: D-alanyl-D-alanine carboxypeptidase/D-alanyl-D-alanine-endopeptidase [Candidatus Kapaibacterium sp.]|nr:MAG: D-alanyl-D-alanine carboxypeptidase/D-alanyl-D-alanine-endopeptidase [Candidatus Kapabacteria bacterium]